MTDLRSEHGSKKKNTEKGWRFFVPFFEFIASYGVWLCIDTYEGATRNESHFCYGSCDPYIYFFMFT